MKHKNNHLFCSILLNKDATDIQQVIYREENEHSFGFHLCFCGSVQSVGLQV